MMNKNECNICCNDNNQLKKCNICINSICDICIGKLDIELITDEIDEKIELKFKCPYCNSINIINNTYKNYLKIYEEKTNDLIFDLLNTKRSLLFINNKLKQYEKMFENKYYEVNTDILLTT